MRNYVYTQFAEIAASEGIELVYWNNTPLGLEPLGYQEIPFPKVSLHWQTDILKNAIKHLELNLFKEQTGSTIYDAYKFCLLYTSPSPRDS